VAELNRRSPVGLRLGLRREGKLDSRSLPGRLYADCTPKWRNYAAESPVGLRLGLSAGVRSSNSSSRSLPSGLYADLYAEVAELADAPDSKSGARKGVWVRFPPSALQTRLATLSPPQAGFARRRLASSTLAFHPKEGGSRGKHGFPRAGVAAEGGLCPPGGSPRQGDATAKKGVRGGNMVSPTLN
jgi:hypothetical protein